MKKYIAAVAASALVLLFGACGENYIDEPVQGDDVTDSKIELDTITSRHIYNYTYNEEVAELSDAQVNWLDPGTMVYDGNGELRFKAGTPDALIPREGQIVVSSPNGTVIPVGFMGRVISVDRDAAGTVVRTCEVELEEVYRDLDLNIRLNADQLRNSMSLFGIDEDEASPYAASAKGVSANPSRGGIEIELVKIGDGYKISFAQAFGNTGNEDNPIEIKPSGAIILRPLYKEIIKRIEQGESGDFTEEQGWDLSFVGDMDLILESSNLSDKFTIKSPTLRAIIPTSTPIVVQVLDQIELGLKGEIKLGLGWDSHFIIKSRTVSRGGEVVSKAVETNFNWADGLKWHINELEFEGGLFFKNTMGSTVGGVPLMLLSEQEAMVSGSANLLDKNLYKENPMLTFSIETSMYLHMPDPEDWTEPIWNFKFFYNRLEYDSFAVFPQCDNWTVVRPDSGTSAEASYQSSLFCLFWPFIGSLEFDIVTRDWLNYQADQYVYAHLKPEFVNHKLQTFSYKFNVGGLDPDQEYYAVPICNILGVRYYGEPMPMKSNATRLGIIGPSLVMPSAYATFRYDAQGRVSRIDNHLSNYKAYISYNPFSLRDVGYEHDSDGNYVAVIDDDIIYTDAVFDETSGVITECIGRGEDSGRVAFEYNDNYNLTAIAVEGLAAISLEWDSKGKLLKAVGADEEGTITIEYGYPLAPEKNKNTHMQWTVCAGMPGAVFAFARLVGRPSSYLPSKMTITEIDGSYRQTDVFDIKYEFNKDGSVAMESYRTTETPTWLDLPYGYREVGVSDQVMEHDGFLGTSRSAASPEDVDRLKASMRRLSNFGLKRKK